MGFGKGGGRQNLESKTLLVHLDHAVDLADEPEAGKESYRARKQEEQKDHNERVAKVQEDGRGVLNL